MNAISILYICFYIFRIYVFKLFIANYYNLTLMQIFDV